MRIGIALVSFLFVLQTSAQLNSGFDKVEARDMLAICNSFTFLDLYNSDKEILPWGYEKRYTSGVFGMDNKFQIYVKNKVAVINLRGSTDKKVSWLENIHSAMIPAKGTIEVNGEPVEYCFADHPSAAVHSGYALGVVFLIKDLTYHISALNREGIKHVILTGHSQGGALANMLTAYFGNAQESNTVDKCFFKTYAFAAPMTGNREFSEEYNTRYCETGMSYNIVNPADPVPGFPMSYKDSAFVADNLTTLLFDTGSFNFKDVMSDGMTLLFEEKMSRTIQGFSRSASKQIANDVGSFILPPYVEDFNFQKLSNCIEIPPVEYPRILRDSSILENDSLMFVYVRNAEGHFTNEALYVSQPIFYQHKPYNYYSSFMRSYFPEEYADLRRKYLPENL